MTHYFFIFLLWVPAYLKWHIGHVCVAYINFFFNWTALSKLEQMEGEKKES